MTTCSHCGAKKAQQLLACETCSGIDERVIALRLHGTPGLTIAGGRQTIGRSRMTIVA